MISSNIDLGQIILGSLIAIVGWFVKKEIQTFGKRIDKHEDVIFRLAGDIQRLIGAYEALKISTGWTGPDRRQNRMVE